MSGETISSADWNVDTEQSSVLCPYCMRMFDDGLHSSDDCDAFDDVARIRATGQFGIVVPRETGYVWVTKAAGEENERVSIQGVYIQIGNLREYRSGDDEPPVDVEDIDLGEFEDEEAIRRALLKAMSDSADFEYGYTDLGSRLISEHLDARHEDDASRNDADESVVESVEKVWERIDQNLPFVYEQVRAPDGYPTTREGVRWINVTGHNVPDYVDEEDSGIFKREWVDRLINEGPVALYYPNSG